MPETDPYAAFGGAIQPAAATDPYAAFGGSVAGSSPASDMSPSSSPGRGGRRMPPEQAREQAIANTPTGNGGWGMGKFATGVDQLTNLGNNRPNQKLRGIHNAVTGAGEVLAPLALPAVVAAPLSALGVAAAGAAGSAIGRAGAKALGAPDDVADLAGDVGGLAAGVGGGKVTSLLGRKVATGLANSALGTTAKFRQFGTNPGAGVLEETEGVRPSTVASSAGKRIADLSRAKSARLAQASPVSLTEARSTIAAGRQLAATRGDVALDRELAAMEATLSRNGVTGEEYPDIVPASKAQEILRGFANQHPDFVEGRTTDANGIAKGAWAALRNSIRTGAPGVQELDERMHNLIPARNLAVKANNLAGTVETGVNRMTRPTGGMIPAIAGYAHGGPVGGAAVMAAQEALGQPAVKMGAARAIYRGVGGGRVAAPSMPITPPAVIRGLLGPASPTSVDSDLGSRHGDLIGQPQSNRQLPALDPLDEANLRGAPVETSDTAAGVPETGIPDPVARGVAAREDIARKFGRNYADLSPKEMLAIDDLIAEGNIGAPDAPKKPSNPYR